MYATVADMTARFGETQMIRLSRPEDRTADTIDAVKVETAITDACAVIDGYIRAATWCRSRPLRPRSSARPASSPATTLPRANTPTHRTK